MVTNTNNAFGFRQFGHRDGSAPTMGLERRFISSANTGAIYTGDAVILSSGGGSYIYSGGSTGNGATAVPAISSLLVGVFYGCEYYNTNVNRVTWSSYWPGSGATGDVTAYVCTDPEMTYLVQGTTGAVIGTSQIGVGFPMTISSAATGGVGNTTTGQSAMCIQSSLPTGLSSNAQFILVDLYSNVAPPGVNGTSTGSEAMQICIVQPNNAQRRTITGVGAGVTFST